MTELRLLIDCKEEAGCSRCRNGRLGECTTREICDGARVADAGEFGVLVPVLERLEDAGVLLGVVNELGPGEGMVL